MEFTKMLGQNLDPRLPATLARASASILKDVGFTHGDFLPKKRMEKWWLPRKNDGKLCFLPRTVVDVPHVSYNCKRKIAFGQYFMYFLEYYHYL